jgi:competence protein ComEC
MGITAAGWLLENTLHLLRFISAFDGVAMQTFVPTSIEIACFYGILSLLLVLRPGTRTLRGAVLLLVLVFCADGLYWGYQRFWHSDLRVTVLDVGQGSAALVEFPGGATMLIDGGGYTDNRYFDIGARVVAPFLRARKVMQVDTIVLSHPSSDHMNGLVYVLDHFHPRRLLWTGDRAPTESFRRFYREVIDSATVVAPWQTIQRRREFAGVAVEVLNPLPGDPTAPPFSDDTLNNRSIVLKLAMGGCTILFTGDIEARAEAKLVSCCRSQLASQVLIAPHHGSRTSSTVDFIDAVDPQVVIFSVGWRNRFGFPHTSVIERFQKWSPRIYRTDHHGAIQLRTDGNRWKVKATLE